jgi:hypothetical protein
MSELVSFSLTVKTWRGTFVAKSIEEVEALVGQGVLTQSEYEAALRAVQVIDKTEGQS